MKFLTIPKKGEEIDNSLDGIIVGLKDLSVNYKLEFDLEEIGNLKYDGEIFVAINKNIFNHEIKTLENSLIELEKIGVAGVLFYDLAVLSIVKRLNLKINLIWNQTHMVTNYNTCNYYYKNGVFGAYLANEITLEEMIAIKENSNIKVFANIIYVPVMSYSKRHLLTNYFHNINEQMEKDAYKITDSATNKSFLAREDKHGTAILYGNVVNGIKPLFEMIKHEFEYGIIDATFLTDDEYTNAISLIKDVKLDQNEGKIIIERANEVFGEDTGFFYKKTIYKVK